MKDLIDRFDTPTSDAAKRNGLQETPTREKSSGSLVGTPLEEKRGSLHDQAGNTATSGPSTMLTAMPSTVKSTIRMPMNEPQKIGQPSAMTTTLPIPQKPMPRSWLDKLVDFMVGEGPSARYALICQKCHQHNGLIAMDELDFTPFVCMYCNYGNPARKPKLSIQNLKLANDSQMEKTKKSENKSFIEPEASDIAQEKQLQPLESIHTHQKSPRRTPKSKTALEATKDENTIFSEQEAEKQSSHKPTSTTPQERLTRVMRKNSP